MLCHFQATRSSSITWRTSRPEWEALYRFKKQHSQRIGVKASRGSLAVLAKMFEFCIRKLFWADGRLNLISRIWDSVKGSLRQIGLLSLEVERAQLNPGWKDVEWETEMWTVLHLFLISSSFDFWSVCYVLAFEDVCTYISFSCHFVHLCAFRFFAESGLGTESCLGGKPSNSEAV